MTLRASCHRTGGTLDIFSLSESLQAWCPCYRFGMTSRGLNALLIALQDKTNNVIDLYKDILRAVEDLATCSYTTESFTELLGRIQAAVSRVTTSSVAC
jgi:hypothetical protein